MEIKCKSYLFGLLALLCLLPSVTFAQNIRVEGQVKDEKGEPMIGVSVVIEGSGTGVVTDLDGNFILPSVSQKATLEFSYIGYVSQPIQPLGSQHTCSDRL